MQEAGASHANRSITVSWGAPPATGAPAYTSYVLVVRSEGVEVSRVAPLGTGIRAYTVTGLTGGRTYTVAVQAVNVFGVGAAAESAPVTVASTPLPPTALVAARGDSSARLTWTPADDGGSPVTGYTLQLSSGGVVLGTRALPADPTSATVTGLTNGTSYTFRLQAVTALGASGWSAPSAAVTPGGVPGAPTILVPKRGAAGGALTAVATWEAPTVVGGSAVTGYRVSALRMATDGVTPVGAPVVQTVGAKARSKPFTLAAGTYRFEVVAVNAFGDGPPSARSAPVSPR